MIMDGKFTKIIYSDELFILYGIFLNVSLFVDVVTNNGELGRDRRSQQLTTENSEGVHSNFGNKLFYRFQANHIFNEKMINDIIQIEHHILEFYRDTFKINKQFTTILRNQLYNGYIKTYSSGPESDSISNFSSEKHSRSKENTSNYTTDGEETHNKLDDSSVRQNLIENVYPRKQHFLLKISGIWEDNENIGLTYKFENIHSKLL